MIILLGPDGTGKTTLAKKLAQTHGLDYYHFTMKSGYSAYIEELSALKFRNAVLDRHAICELPYSTVMERQFQFTLKQWHNVLLLTLAHNPVIYLATHKPHELDYPKDQYLPYSRWDMCLNLYKSFLNTNLITYKEWDYLNNPNIVEEAHAHSQANNESSEWWTEHWRNGYGYAGSSTPKFLVIAERIGPSNAHSIPFEAGPTGFMMSNLLSTTKTPLGSIAITNMVKAKRGDSRKVNDRDLELLREEISHLRPKKIIFMGAVAKAAIPIAKEFACEVDTIPHLGYFNHKGVKDMSGYYNEWRKVIGLVPTISYT